MLASGGATMSKDQDDESVKHFAEVETGGKPIGGVLWKPLFVLDVTRAFNPGNNDIAVKVTNLWPNRMIGDSHPGRDEAVYVDRFSPLQNGFTVA